MADEEVQPTDGAVDEPKIDGLTEDKVKAMLEERDRTWQSRFDKLLKEKRETETKSKTAEERIAEIERRYEEERLGRTRERVLHKTSLDESLMESMREFLGNDEEGIERGASRIREYIQQQIEAGVKTGVEQEVAKRFKDAPKPQGGPPGGEMSKEEFLSLTDEQLQSLGTQKVSELTRLFSKR